MVEEVIGCNMFLDVFVDCIVDYSICMGVVACAGNPMGVGFYLDLTTQAGVVGCFCWVSFV